MDIYKVFLFLVSVNVLCVYAVTGSGPGKGRVVIAGLFPLSYDVPEGMIGRGVRPAVDLAISMINNNTDILPHHTLEIVASDTKTRFHLDAELASAMFQKFLDKRQEAAVYICDMAVATKFFFDMVDSNNTVAMVFGDACSRVSGPVAEISKEWNMWLVSYADTDPVLSDRKKYNNFYRTVPSESDFNPARLALIRKFNWTNVGTLFQGVSKGTARYGHAHNHLMSLLEKENINVMKSAGFVNDPGPAIQELKTSDARIILGNFDHNMARLVFCHAFKANMYGPKYQWIILGGYPAHWWAETDEHIGCSPAELNKTIHGYITTDILQLSSDREPTESGLTPDEYSVEYTRQNGGHFSKFHAYAFDGVWVIAKVVHYILNNNSSNKSSSNNNTHDLFRGSLVSTALNHTNFRGVTGQMKFEGGDRIGSIVLEQFQGGDMLKIGEYHKLDDRLSFDNCHSILWQGKGPPIDRKLERIMYLRVPRGVYVVICSLAGVGMFISVLFLGVNITFREHRYIKMSSPNLNNVIIIGCILTYLSVVLLGTDGGVVNTLYLEHICTARAWVLTLGFTLAFGAMFSKTWRVYSIFKEITLHKKVIKDYKLYLMVTILLIIDGGILVTWQILDPLETAKKNMTTVINGDLYIIPVKEYCRSSTNTIWLGLIYAYKGVLLVFGCFLAWATRHVSIPALNDSKYIGMSVYNVVIMCICGAAVSVVINDQPTSSFVIISFFIIFCTTITLCLVFVPKIIELQRDPTGEEGRIRARLKKPKRQTSCDDADDGLHKMNAYLLEQNIKYRNALAEKIRIVHALMERLELDTLGGEVNFSYSQTIDFSTVTSSSKPMSAISYSSNMEDLSPLSTHSILSTPDIDINSTSLYRGNNSYNIETAEVMQISARPSVSERKSSTYSFHPSCTGTDSDDDDVDTVFGGVYCGTVKRASIKLNNSFKSYGSRGRGQSEVKPLLTNMQSDVIQAAVNDLSKLYLEDVYEANSCGNTDKDLVDKINDSCL